MTPQPVPIRKGIPLPAKPPGRRGVVGQGAFALHPWMEMDVGDSFVALPQFTEPVIRNTAYQMSDRFKRRYSVRVTDEGVAVWRMK